MSLFHLAAAAGLLGLVGGVVVVNVASTPRAAQIGTIMAGCGVVMLVLVFVWQNARLTSASAAAGIRPVAEFDTSGKSPA